SSVLETGRYRMALNDLECLTSLRIAGEKRGHFFWIGLARLRVGPRSNQEVIETLRIFREEYRETGHRSPPLLAVGQLKQKSQAPNLIRCIRTVWVTATKRETAGHLSSAGSEDSRFRQTRALAVALEKTTDSHALGVIATETGMHSIHL